MRRRLSLACLLVGILAMSPSAAAKSGASWAQAELNAVVASGLMSGEAAARPNDPLTRTELETLLSGLFQTSPATPANASAPVSITTLDARLVDSLGLADSARALTDTARAAGISPPARFGSETLARLLALRTNHPAALDRLELSPGEPATHAEAAFSAARVMRLEDWSPLTTQELAATFTLPPLTSWQKRILTTAVRFIGYPYVWGGESEYRASPFGRQAHGGFDCSGFVWRVYKLQAYPGEGTLATTLSGRTTYAMSGEVPRSKRIDLADLQPADVIFFGAKGPASAAAQVDHMGIYLGGGWFIHSSSYGVAVTTLSGWYAQRFAWARRPLAEAGLISFS
jgi:cell wall-associated NlpC family hydrolase